MPEVNEYTFRIALSVLDQLGRKLYRNFITVIGEAISNSWDADAKNIWIEIDQDKREFLIFDDGIGMNPDDFQTKFLTIGYTKRKNLGHYSPAGRPYIGQKGIGKLALLSCASDLTVMTKSKNDTAFHGGKISNSSLDKSMQSEAAESVYTLEPPNELKIESKISNLLSSSKTGTVLLFEEFNASLTNVDRLKTLIALYFKFTLIDRDFKIYVNNIEVTDLDLTSLIKDTQFVWKISDYVDPYIEALRQNGCTENTVVYKKIQGYIASVNKPSQLNIHGLGEQVSIDLFVNGRLRERNILQHVPTARLASQYLYGQIHYDELVADGEDRFTSSREEIIGDDPIYQSFLENEFKRLINQINNAWDEQRRKNNQDGDSENDSVGITKMERKSEELANAAMGEFGSSNVKFMKKLSVEIKSDLSQSLENFSQCYFIENLIRGYIEQKEIEITDKTNQEIEKFKARELKSKEMANIIIDVRSNSKGISYLGLTDLARIIEPEGDPLLKNLSKQYKPFRDAVAHTSCLTPQASIHLTAINNQIQALIEKLK